MPEVVKVSTVENSQDIEARLEEYFKTGRYAEITQAIGIYSILIDPSHTLNDQSRLYHSVLRMIKEKLQTSLGKHYSAWYVNFPKLMNEMIASGTEIKDRIAVTILASHHDAFGPFKSLDDFFFWSLDDRRLTLEQIVQYIEKTTAMPCR